MPEAAFADVDAGRILLRAPFSNLLLCQRIAGSRWDHARRLWTFPATPHHARQIRASIPRLEVSGQFAALLGEKAEAARPIAPPPPAPRPEPAVELPHGLKTKPWRHQVEAFRFAIPTSTVFGRHPCPSY